MITSSPHPSFHEARASASTRASFGASDPYNQKNGGILGDAYYKFDPKSVNPATAPDPMIQQQLYAKSVSQNRATGYSDAPYIEESLLSQVYFSADNEQIIQNGLREGVYAMSLQPDHKGPPFIMSPQNANIVKSVMCGIFTRHYTDRVPAGATITEQVATLNNQVWKHAVPKLYDQAVSYLFFLEQLDKPIQTQAMPPPEIYDRDWKKSRPTSRFL